MIRVYNNQGYQLKSEYPFAVGSSGEIQFNNAGLLGSDDGLFWDNVNKRLGIGTTTPVYPLEVSNNGSCGVIARNTVGSVVKFLAGGTAGQIGTETNNPLKLLVNSSVVVMTLDTNGYVGVGTSTPSFNFEVQDSGANVSIVANRTDGAEIEIAGTSSSGLIQTRSDHSILISLDVDTTNTAIMQLNRTGNYIAMQQGGGYYDGDWIDGSSRIYKENIENLNLEDAELIFENINPVKYNRKNNKNEIKFGFIAEDVPEIISSNNRKALNPMSFIAILTKILKKHDELLNKISGD